MPPSFLTPCLHFVILTAVFDKTIQAGCSFILGRKGRQSLSGFFDFKCPSCSNELELEGSRQEWEGQVFTCPICRIRLRVPKLPTGDPRMTMSPPTSPDAEQRIHRRSGRSQYKVSAVPGSSGQETDCHPTLHRCSSRSAEKEMDALLDVARGYVVFVGVCGFLFGQFYFRLFSIVSTLAGVSGILAGCLSWLRPRESGLRLLVALCCVAGVVGVVMDAFHCYTAFDCRGYDYPWFLNGPFIFSLLLVGYSVLHSKEM